MEQLQQLQAFHVVLTTHNSRTSYRMKKYNVKKGPPRILTLNQEIHLAIIFKDIIKEYNIRCITWNICQDHVHFLIVCLSENLSNQVRIIKSISSRKFQRLSTIEENIFHKNHLWSARFFRAELDDWKLASLSRKAGLIWNSNFLYNTVVYINANRKKHQLEESVEMQNIILSSCMSIEDAFGR